MDAIRYGGIPWARAWTCVVFTRIHPRPMIPLTTTVAARAPMAVGGRPAASFGPPGRSFLTDSCRICRKEMTMMMEKTRIPRGSKRLLPTGNFLRSFLILQPTSLLVVQTINVQRRSRAESTSDAMRERDEEYPAAMPFAASRMMLATTLISTH